MPLSIDKLSNYLILKAIENVTELGDIGFSRLKANFITKRSNKIKAVSNDMVFYIF